MEDPCLLETPFNFAPIVVHASGQENAEEETEETLPDLGRLFNGIGIALQGAGEIWFQEKERREKVKEQQKKAKKKEEKKDIIKTSNLNIEKEVTRSYMDKPAKKTKDGRNPADDGIGNLTSALLTLNASGVIDEINAQLKKQGLKVRIRLVIWEDDWLPKVAKSLAVTVGGDPVTIHVRLTSALNLQPVDLARMLAHELLHVKEDAYKRAGRPVPYGGHDAKPFKDKEKALEKKIKEEIQKEKNKKSEGMDEWLKEQGKG